MQSVSALLSKPSQSLSHSLTVTACGTFDVPNRTLPAEHDHLHGAWIMMQLNCKAKPGANSYALYDAPCAGRGCASTLWWHQPLGQQGNDWNCSCHHQHVTFETLKTSCANWCGVGGNTQTPVAPASLEHSMTAACSAARPASPAEHHAQ
jgi:hypothetical protein